MTQCTNNEQEAALLKNQIVENESLECRERLGYDRVKINKELRKDWHSPLCKQETKDEIIAATLHPNGRR